MQFLTSLFGGSENTYITAALALGIVLVLIVLGVWVLKVFFRASTTLTRGRNRRLTVIDSVSVDPRRRLIIVRRDNVEHLIMTGGPQDLVVESNIPVDRSPGPMRRASQPDSAEVPAGALPATERPSTPSQPVTDALAAAQALLHGSSRASERTRDLGRTAAGRKGVPLRQTGLMRPVTRMEPGAVIPMNPDNSEHRRVDSAKTGPANDTNGQGRLAAGRTLGDGA